MDRRREASVGLAIAALAVLLAVVASGFFVRANLIDIFLGNLPVLVAALGTLLIILTGEIDISIGSVFAVCGVAAGLCADAGLPMPLSAAAALLCGLVAGSLNGAFVAYLELPSIVVTLASMVAVRDALRWMTQGAWVQNLPTTFQWFGLRQEQFPIVAFAIAAALAVTLSWGLRHLGAGRAIYATGSDLDAARLAGLDTRLVKFTVFAAGGALTGLAALLNAVRFNQIPSNAGLGLELKVIAAVVVGGAAIRGGRGSVAGTVLGVVLLALVGPALVFLGINAYWERAIQGLIILAAVMADAIPRPRAAAVEPAMERCGAQGRPQATEPGSGAKPRSNKAHV
jgi:rhamnose transport system permease protein